MYYRFHGFWTSALLTFGMDVSCFVGGHCCALWRLNGIPDLCSLDSSDISQPTVKTSIRVPGHGQESPAGVVVGSMDPAENRLLFLDLRSLRTKGHSAIATLLRKAHTRLRPALFLHRKDGPNLPCGLGWGDAVIAYIVLPF